MSTCYIYSFVLRPPTAFRPLSVLRLSAFPLPRFSSGSTIPSEQTRAHSFFLAFPFSSLTQLNLRSFLLLPGCRALQCRPFVTLSVPLDYVFFSRARLLPLPDPFILLPGFPLSPSAFRHFSLFLYLFPERSSTSTFLLLSPFHSCSLFFGRIGLFSFSFSCRRSPSVFWRLSSLSSRHSFSSSLVFILTFNDNRNYVVHRVSLRGN